MSRAARRWSRSCTSAARPRGSAAARRRSPSQHAADKLTARERLALLIDDGTFTELGIHARPHFSQRAMEGRDAPADGVITGYGKVDGRLVAVCAYDFTVMAGSMGMTGEMKVTRLRELALTKRMPFVWLLDSAGARIQEAVGSLFAGSGHLFREEVDDERRDPAGRGADGAVRGGHRLHPRARRLRADGQGPRLDGAGRPAPRARRDRRGRHAGGARRLARALPQVGRRRPRGRRRRGVHRSAIKEYLSFFPSHCEEPPPRRAVTDPVDRARRGAARRAAGVQPQAVRHVRRDPADRRRRRVASTSSRQWAKTIITCLARIGGRPVGIVANQPRQLGGILDNDSADKAARFVNLCNAFGIPLVFLMDVPGLHGRHQGRGGRDHPPRREDALRGRQRDRARRSRSCCARPTAPATT